MKIIFTLYFGLIAFPIILVLTVFTALLTILLAPLLPHSYLSYLPARVWSRLICWLAFVKIETNGFDHLDRKKSYIFVSNHQSVFDIFVIYGWLPIVFKWIMKNDLKKIPLVGRACASAGHIFINRSNAIAAQKSLLEASEKLKKGNSVVVFPEGTRTRTGAMGRFKRGAFLLAKELDLPIVPMTLSGSYERLPPSSLFPTAGTIRLYVHKPVYPDSYAEKPLTVLMTDVEKIVATPTA